MTRDLLLCVMQVRRPCDLVCIVDVSGSMQIAAMVKTAGGEVRSGEGMTRLCLVKQVGTVPICRVCHAMSPVCCLSDGTFALWHVL